MSSAAPAEPAAQRGASHQAAVATLGIVAMVLVQFAWVKPTNFGGFDEWAVLLGVAQGNLGAPHANRPLQFLWSLPARLGPPSVWTYYAMHTSYLAGLGCLVFLLVRRLTTDVLVAFLAGVFTVSWAPLDYHRLNVILAYGGLTFSAFLALLLLVESWHRRRPVLLLLAALVAFLSLRGFEASLPLLVAAPLFLPWSRRPERPWRWIAAWEACVLLAAALIALPLLFPSRGLFYQRQVLGGLDLDAVRVTRRLAELYGYHVLPLVTSAPGELAVPAVPAAVAAFVAAFFLVARRLPTGSGVGREYLRPMGVGLGLAGLGYSVYVLSSGLAGAARTQFLAGPGIGLLLASSFALLASFAPPRWRRPVLCVLGAWVVAVGTGRTLALQRFWDQISVHADQMRLLRGLVEIAPRFKPNTFVLLVLDDPSVFASSFTFRQALDYLYPDPVVGSVWKGWDVFYPVRFNETGVLAEPWPEFRERAPVTAHRFDEVVILHQPKAGGLRLVAQWPAGVLPPLPPGSSYDPLSRILQGPSPPERRILGGASLP